MTDTAVARPAMASSPSLQSRPFLPALVILFIGSGCAALIYEIVWLQMLGLEIGASAVSLGVLLGTFMGGMCIGSLLFSRVVSRSMHPLLVYGLLEGAIGLIGLLELWLIPSATGMYVHFATPGAGAIALRATIAGVCLLPPTILMGATLPAISRYVESSPRGVSWMGFFYGGNIGGAVIGCLWAGYRLLPQHDVSYATRVAFGINVGVAVLAIILASISEHEAPEESQSGVAAPTPDAWAVYVAIGLSGLTGLGAEVIWTRQLSLMLAATVYTFSNILAVFLLGLGIGSAVGAFIARSTKEPKVALAWCQLLLAGGVAWAAYSISFSIPFWPVNPGLTDNPNYTFQLNLAACFWALLPGALLWGASFPIALAAIARRGQDPGRLVGRVYAANTVGAILGSLLFSMIFMPYLGSRGSQQLLIAICVISGVIAIIPVFKRMMAPPEDGGPGTSAAAMGATIVGLFLAIVVALGLMIGVGAPNWGAVAWGRNSATNMPWLFPAVLAKVEPLDYLEQRTMDEACKFSPGFKTLKVEDGKLVYTLDDDAKDADKVKIDGWAKDNERLMVSALNKRAAFTTEYEVVRQANEFRKSNARYIKSVELEPNGDFRFVPVEGATEKETAINQKFADERGKEFLERGLGDRKADLVSALRKVGALTGTASIMPYNRNYDPDRYCVFVGEGMNVSVAVTYDNSGYRYFHGAGKVQASSNPEDMRLQRTLGHISALTYYAQTKKKPEDVLVVACGAGVTAGSFVPYGSNITIVDIEQMVPKYVTPQFWDSNHDVIPPSWSGRPTGYKKTNIVIDDGRHYIKTVDKKFDVITSDPIDPWVKGCAALNTVEYYQMCKSHLKPGGIMALWIPLYESSESTSKSIIATFFKVFPNGIIWANDQNGQGYDCTLFGSVAPDGSDAPLKIDIDEIQDFLDDPNHAAIKRSLQDVHYGDSGDPGRCEAVDLFATYAGSAPRMKEWTKGTEDLINYDRNLRLQYVAGLGVNNVDEVRIFNNMLYHYSWPDEIFVKGTPERMQALKDLLSRTGRVDRSASASEPKIQAAPRIPAEPTAPASTAPAASRP